MTTKPAKNDDETVEGAVERSKSTQEMQEDKKTAKLEAAPYPADPKEAHRIATERFKNERNGDPHFSTSDLQPVIAGETQKQQTVPCRLLYDWWDGQGIRHEHGKTLDLPLNEAKRLIGEKKAERADPLPGDDK